MKKFGISLAVLFFCFVLSAQGDKKDARIVGSSLSYEMTSSTTATITVRKSVIVTDAKGDDAAFVLIYNDYFTTLKSFSGHILSPGKKQKLSMSDLSYTEYSSNLADDSKFYHYRPAVQYPYELDYEYVVLIRKGIVSFPSFRALSTPNTSLDADATYSLFVPKGLEIGYNSSGVVAIDKSSPKYDKYVWTFRKNDGFVEEDNMPEFRESGSYLYACPLTFTYGGIQGSQKTWSDLGLWLNALQKGCCDLPDDFKEKVRAMTKDCNSDYERVKRLYDYMAANTRYVSIQLGIGGLKSIPASETLKTGYGDCKSLSTFLKAMLDAIGIRSECVIVNTDHKDILSGCSSISQMNHMMLCVPLASDTLWVECTNPRYPLGYRHESIAGHQVIIISGEGGKMTRVPEYDPALRRESNSYKVDLSSDGSARCSLEEDHFLNLSEPYYSFKSLSPEKQESALTRYDKFRHSDFRVISVSDNFAELDGRGKVSSFCPKVAICSSLTAMNYAKVFGDRIFVPVNPMSKAISTTSAARVNDIYLDQSWSAADSISLSIPEGYDVESLPPGVSLKSVFGDFTSTVSRRGNVLLIVQVLSMSKGNFPASSYDGFRSFAEAVSKSYDSKLVLKRK